MGQKTTEPEVSQTAQAETPFTALGQDEILSKVGKLPAQQLGENECGLFLWLRRDDLPLVFFQHSDGRAYMAVNDDVHMLERTEAEEPVALQYFRKQSFVAKGMKVSVSVEPEASPSLQQGLKVPNGTISLEVDGGWAAALPVAGLIGCR
ncbi:MAG: hypothetical protein AB3N28_16905 [Kordiimonas sp.]